MLNVLNSVLTINWTKFANFLNVMRPLELALQLMIIKLIASNAKVNANQTPIVTILNAFGLETAINANILQRTVMMANLAPLIP
jgi:hypothetical protein